MLNGGTLRILSGGSFRLGHQDTSGKVEVNARYNIQRSPASARAARPNEAGRPPAPRTAIRRLLFVILTAQLMVVLDATIVNVALPHIQRGLGFSGTGLSWVLNAYILTFGGLLLLGARAGDLLGRRRTFLFGIAPVLGGFVGRRLGHRRLDAAGRPGPPGRSARPWPPPPRWPCSPRCSRRARQRVRAIGLFTTVSAAGGAIGLVAGGLLTEWASWRWVMFVNVPIGLAVWLVGRLVLVETERRHGRFDIAGAVTSTIGMTGHRARAWSRPEAAVGLTPSPSCRSWPAWSCCGLFVRNERRAEEPILPLRLLAELHPQRRQLGPRPGLCRHVRDVLLPVPVPPGRPGVLAARRRGRFPADPGLGLSLLPADEQGPHGPAAAEGPHAVGRQPGRPSSLLLSSQLHAGASYLQVLVNLVLLGAGAGISLVSLTSASLAGVDPSDAGAASGLINVVQQLGAALGLAVLVTVFGADHPPCPARYRCGFVEGLAGSGRPGPRARHRLRHRRRLRRPGHGHGGSAGEARPSTRARPPAGA